MLDSFVRSELDDSAVAATFATARRVTGEIFMVTSDK